MAQLVASVSGVVLDGVAEVVGSNLAKVKIFTASIGSVDSLYPPVYIYIYNILPLILSFQDISYHQINFLPMFVQVSIFEFPSKNLYPNIAVSLIYNKIRTMFSNSKYI